MRFSLEHVCPCARRPKPKPKRNHRGTPSMRYNSPSSNHPRPFYVQSPAGKGSGRWHGVGRSLLATPSLTHCTRTYSISHSHAHGSPNKVRVARCIELSLEANRSTSDTTRHVRCPNELARFQAVSDSFHFSRFSQYIRVSCLTNTRKNARNTMWGDTPHSKNF